MFKELLTTTRLIAILRLDDLTFAREISQALLDGGIRLQEYTLTNRDAISVVERLRCEVDDFRNGTALLGVGSVRSASQASEAIAAGAQFVVTPTLQPEVIEVCRQRETPVAPGGMTPTEILTAWELGASVVKLFPARGLGPSYVKDCLAPLPDVQLMPTGGIDLSNMRDYFAAGAVGVGVGGNLLDKQAIATCDWGRLTAVARRYAQAAAKR